LRLLKANLGEYRERCEIAEFALRQPLIEKTEPILAARPRILGVSVSIWNHIATLELLKALEAAWAEGQAGDVRPVVVLGGPEVSWLPGTPRTLLSEGEERQSREAVLEASLHGSPPEDAELFRYADFVIRGEGEHAFRKLCETILVTSEEAGIANEKFIAAPAPDLSGLTSPYVYYTDEDLNRKLVYVEASRGCPFRCEFCLSSIGGEVRNFPLDPFLADMDRLIERGARTFKFLDRTFNLDIGRAKRIMEFFLGKIEQASSGSQVSNGNQSNGTQVSNGSFAGSSAEGRQLCVHFEMVPSRFPADLRETLRRFPQGPKGTTGTRGCLRLELGIQTLNPETAALIGRPSNADEDLEVLDFLRRETGAIVHADLIAGLPGEDLASFGRGFDRLWQVQPVEIQLGILKCLPGTPINRHTQPYGMRYAVLPPYEVLETASMPEPELDRIKNFAHFWELIINRHNFDEFSPRLFPPEKPVFTPFMALADRLLTRFGRNWGIDRRELRLALEEFPGRSF
jgi:hypothetical protein